MSGADGDLPSKRRKNGEPEPLAEAEGSPAS